MINFNRKKVATLIRMLSSDHEGEVVNSARALKKIVNLNDLGNWIENSTGGGKDSITKKEMQEIFDAGMKTGEQSGFEKGYLQGKKEGIAEGKKYGDSVDFEHVDGSTSNVSEKDRVLYVKERKDKVKSPREKDFVESCIHWSTVLKRPLTAAQAKWFNDIYKRLGGQ